MTFLSFRCAGLLVPLMALLALPARAQRLSDPAPVRDPFGHPPAPEVPGGRYLSHSYKNGVLTIKATDGSTRQVRERVDGVIKIDYYAPGRQPVADSSVSVVKLEAWEASGLSKEEHTRLISQSSAFRFPGKTAQESGAVLQKAIDQYNTALLTENKSYLRFLVSPFSSNSSSDTYAIITKQNLRISLVRGTDTLFSEAAPAYRRQPTVSPAADVPPIRIDELNGTGVRFQLQPGERLYGTGARALPLDRRGYRLELYNQAHYGYGNGEPALNVTLPVVLSSRGYMVLFDHHAAAYLDMGKKNPDALEYGVEGLNSLSYYVITGQSQVEILRRYTALTGRQPLPPRWALGLIQSRFGYRSQVEMLDVARKMRANDFPLDALVLDLYWFGGTTRQGDFQWDARNFPDPAGMMRDLKAQGVNTILISEPYVMRTSLNDSLVRTQALVGTTAAGRPFTVGSFWAGPASILDVYKPATRTWLWAQYKRLHDQGAAGWWSDLGEPENHPDAMQHVLGPARQVHNAYGITWAKIFQDHYAQEYPQERLFNLARSGWAGMQRNSVFPWSGDISRTWSGLQAQVPIMLSMGQAGVGYMHSDAGGFGANATQDPELYTRWLQLAALCPIMRPHSDQVVPPEPYTYPEPYRSIVRKYAHLRAELLPYLYTLAAENTLTGAPLVRAMDYTLFHSSLSSPSSGWTIYPPMWTPWLGLPDSYATSDWPADRYSLGSNEVYQLAANPVVPDANDQFMLGSQLLVAPVSEPGQRRRNVALPPTPGGWIDWETGQMLPGGQVVGLAASLGHIPLLARTGAIIPLTAYRPNTAAYRSDTLSVRYFPELPEPTAASHPSDAPSSVFTLYEDDGHSAQALAKRQFATIRLLGFVNPHKTTFTAAVTGTYPGAPSTRLLRLRVARVAGPPTVILLNKQPLPTTAWYYNAAQHELAVDFSVQTDATLTIENLHLFTNLAPNLDPETLTLTAPDSRTFSGTAGLHYVRYVSAAMPELVRIRNARGQVVRELPTATGAGTHSLTWDGRNAQGQPASPGYYDVELQGQHQRLAKME